MGQRIFHISERPKDANLGKLSGNFLIASVMEALGEALALIGKAGIDKNAYLDLLTSTLFGAPVYKTYGKLIAGGSFEPAVLGPRSVAFSPGSEHSVCPKALTPRTKTVHTSGFSFQPESGLPRLREVRWEEASERC